MIYENSARSNVEEKFPSFAADTFANRLLYEYLGLSDAQARRGCKQGIEAKKRDGVKEKLEINSSE